MSIQINRLTTYRTLFLALTLSTPGALLAENPSNPLAKSVNTDIRAQYVELRDGSDLTDYFVDGGFMATEKLKVKYELHYWDTNVTGSSEQDWDDETVPATVEVQFGRMFNSGFGLYLEALAGVGDDRPYDWGAGLGLRFVY